MHQKSSYNDLVPKLDLRWCDPNTNCEPVPDYCDMPPSECDFQDDEIPKCQSTKTPERLEDAIPKKKSCQGVPFCEKVSKNTAGRQEDDNSADAEDFMESLKTDELLASNVGLTKFEDKFKTYSACENPLVSKDSLFCKGLLDQLENDKKSNENPCSVGFMSSSNKSSATHVVSKSETEEHRDKVIG